MKLKSFLNFINESEDSDQMHADTKRLFDLGIISRGEYIKDSGLYREVEVFFEFDFTWADQTTTDEAIKVMEEYYTAVDDNIPDGCWIDPESIDIGEMGWGIDRDEEREEVDYGNSAGGSMIMWVPLDLPKETLDIWINRQTNRIVDYFWIEDDSND